MSDWPADYHPLRADGSTNTDVTVQVYPHMAEQVDALADWCANDGAPPDRLFINGAPCLVLHNTRHVTQRICGLGDVVIKPATGQMLAFPGGDLGSNYIRADHQDPPPVDQETPVDPA